MTVSSHLICWALRLQWPPFSWLFRIYYLLAIQFSRLVASRVRGVRSIYLSGSWVRRDVIYGLSDLDFKIFVSGEKDQEIYKSIRDRFAFLRRFFPMLGSPDEKGIYFLQSFEADYRHHPLVQHLFDKRFFQHRLIYGEDILPALPLKPREELDQGECFSSRLKDWIERVHVLADTDVLSTPRKQHLFFKAVGDISLLAIRAAFPEYSFSRRAEILHRICPEIDESYRGLIENLILEHKSLYRLQRNSLNEDFRLVKYMVAFCSEKLSCPGGACCSPNFQRAPLISGAQESAIADTLCAFSPKIRHAVAIRWPQLPQNPFDLHFFNAPAFVLDCAEPLGLEEFHALKTFFRKNLRHKAVLLLREFPQYICSVDSDLVDHWGGFPCTSDLLHACTGNSGLHTCMQLEKQRIEARIRSFQEQLAISLEHPEFGRMDLRIFPKFLLNAIRVLIFAQEFDLGKWLWPVTPADVANYLAERTPLSPSFAQKLLEQFETAENSGTFNERLLHKSRLLLAKMLNISQGGGPWTPLEELNDVTDEQRLTITAAVVTANRPLQLKRCLDSLAKLTRPPEELIVVDTANDDRAQRIVKDFRAACPVLYMRCDRPGVSPARNAALQAAQGEIIAFLDDDACAAPDWLERLERVFLRDEKIGLESGAVSNLQCGRRDLVWRFMETVEKIQS